MTPELLIQLREVCRLTSMGKSTIYELMAKGEFPIPLRIDSRCRWSRAEIEQWVNERLAERGTA